MTTIKEAREAKEAIEKYLATWNEDSDPAVSATLSSGPFHGAKVQALDFICVESLAKGNSLWQADLGLIIPLLFQIDPNGGVSLAVKKHFSADELGEESEQLTPEKGQ